jgi:hypothetical protein
MGAIRKRTADRAAIGIFDRMRRLRRRFGTIVPLNHGGCAEDTLSAKVAWSIRMMVGNSDQGLQAKRKQDGQGDRCPSTVRPALQRAALPSYASPKTQTIGARLSVSDCFMIHCYIRQQVSGRKFDDGNGPRSQWDADEWSGCGLSGKKRPPQGRPR